MSGVIAAVAEGGADALFDMAVDAGQEYIVSACEDAVVDEIMSALQNESVDTLVEIYRTNGWGNLITDEMMTNIFNAVNSDPENADLAASIARLCIHIGRNNPFMVMEESITIFTRLGPEAQEGFLEALQPFAEEEGRLGEAFQSFINFLRERMAQEIADVPQASRITFLHWVQGKGYHKLQS